MSKKKKNTKAQVIKIPGEIDFGFMHCLYDYRVLPIEHVRRFVNITEYYANRKRKLLIDSGYIESTPISGGYRDQKRQGSAYSITSAGITLLRKNGFKLDKNADALRVPQSQLVYLLTSYDVAFTLVDYGWTFEECRHFKHRLNLNRQGVVKGLLTSPAGAEWVFFITLGGTTNITLAKFKQEMETACGKYRDKTIFVMGNDAFQATLHYFMQAESILRHVKSCKIIPEPMIHSYVRYISTDEEFFSFLQQLNYPVNEVDNGHAIERWQTPDGIILVNLIDMDVVKVYDILEYTGYHLERIKAFRVFTTPALISVHQELLGHLPHVSFEEVDLELIADTLAD